MQGWALSRRPATPAARALCQHERADRRSLALRASAPAHGLARRDALRALIGRQTASGQHHQERQQLCQKAAGRGSPELPVPARVSPEIQRRHERIPKAILDRAWDAQVLLCRRYRKLAARGKIPNMAVVAVARELSGFIWDISRLAMSLAVPHEARAT
ncbi:putative transposase (plasmid) [Cupriavidus necator H16]|uniref:Putative transposase n=1 Tax=Cupriavidus necator (strain ATCC 17699 / DSM 428 / KCTC 22496 / NCIMB 10442 / H16 / Stanier 337) TaxID=381666 RepID=Q7WXC7_CUPNH|nr:putative transposase [Cupriavidus necator H16]